MSDILTGARTRLLVIEDNPVDVDLLRRSLDAAELDFEFTVIDDGAEALDFVSRSRLPSHAPDLAVIDLNLPKHNGLELLREMRTNSALAGVPVLMLSSAPYVDNPAKLENLLVGRFLAKPLDYDDYLKVGLVIREMLSDETSPGTADAAKTP
jgi:two-component system response regulator